MNVNSGQENEVNSRPYSVRERERNKRRDGIKGGN